MPTKFIQVVGAIEVPEEMDFDAFSAELEQMITDKGWHLLAYNVETNAKNDIKMRSLDYLYKRIKKSRIALYKAELNEKCAEEVKNLKNKIEELEWMSGVVLKEDCND